MIFSDPVYGVCQITEPVLLELIAAPSLQRLKKISQMGYAGPYYPKADFSRFVHSVGVCVLLARYGAPLEEQIAGLIHDVSHSAFSHCVDYALKSSSSQKQDYQDNIFADYVRRSEIPGILEKHGFSTDQILDEKNFPLKETELPDLCADRIDYVLRHSVGVGAIKSGDQILDNLKVDQNRWVFENLKSASDFAELFLYINDNYCSSLSSATMFRTVGDYVGYALESGYISHKDLYTTDEEVLGKIAPLHDRDARLETFWRRMNGEIPARDDPGSTQNRVACKVRIVDPLCRDGGKIVRLSDVRPEWTEILRARGTSKVFHLAFD